MRIALVVIACTLVATVAFAQEATTDSVTAEQFEAELGYRTGDIELPNGMATIHVPDGFRYLDQKGSQRLLTDGWGNPAEMSEDVVGMLIPAASPLSEDGWGIVITFDESGYVEDKDASKLNYDKILKQMKKDTEEMNKERKKLGFHPVTLVGWAEPPHYDAATHKLYWAKELAFDEKEGHTLNYCIRVLGRRGVLELNAVAGMERLDEIHTTTPAVLSSIEFNEGHRYADFIKGKDKMAEIGLAGLIVGVAAKAGFFKALLVALVALKKVIIVGVVALLAFVKRLFGRKTARAASVAK